VDAAGTENVSDAADDWRLTNQDAYLRAATLFLRRWFTHRPEWDHDHCEFCRAKFSDEGPDALREGYCTTDGYHWICEPCFNDFRDRFGWSVADSTDVR